MSLSPYAFNEWLEPHRDLFGLALDPTELWLTPRTLVRPRWTSTGYLRPWANNLLKNIDGSEKKTQIGKDGFQVCLDVQHFAPNEISVKTVDNSIIVEAKHEEQKDEQGYISRQFTRRYDLPEGFNVKDVVSSISSDGVLTIKAPPAQPAAVEGDVRQIQIQQTGPAHLNVGNVEPVKEDKKAE